MDIVISHTTTKIPILAESNVFSQALLSVARSALGSEIKRCDITIISIKHIITRIAGTYYYYYY